MPNINLKLRPFMVPNFVQVETPTSDNKTVSIAAVGDLDDKAVEDLLNQFVADVWDKVNNRRDAAEENKQT